MQPPLITNVCTSNRVAAEEVRPAKCAPQDVCQYMLCGDRSHMTKDCLSLAQVIVLEDDANDLLQ